MLKTVLKEGGFYSISDILSKGISFFLLPVYTRMLTPLDYGTIDIITVAGTLATYLVGLEIMQSLVRFTPSIESSITRQRYTSTAFWFYISSFTAFTVLCLIFSNNIASVVLDNAAKPSLAIVGVVSIAITSIYFFLQSVLRLYRKVKEGTIINVLYVIVTSVSAIYLIVYRDIGVMGYFYASIGGGTFGITCFFLLKIKPITFYFDKEVLKLLLRFSIPLIPASIATYLAFYVDRIFIKEYLSLTDLGIYGIAVRFASLVNIVIGGFVMAAGPIVFQHYQDTKTPKQLAEVLHFFIAGMCLFVLLYSMFSKELVMFLTTPSYYDAFQYTAILVLNIFILNIYVFLPGLSIAKKTGLVSLIAIIAATLNIMLNYYLTPLLGIQGAILSTTISSIVAQGVTLYYNQKYYRIPINGMRVMSLFITALGIAVLLPIIEKSRGFEYDWYWISLKLIFCTIIGIACIVMIIKSNVFQKRSENAT